MPVLVATATVLLVSVVYLVAGSPGRTTARRVARPDDNPDIELTTTELAKKYGYPIEVHNVQTEDGYTLCVHRIPTGSNRGTVPGSTANRMPILLQHGLAGSSADWTFMGPGKSLAYLLADKGYDVWLGNNRGNVYSRNETVSPLDRDFWNFSYHELGVYDLPATIDYILNKTGEQRLVYVGHSQGTTQFWVGMSQRPGYNEKIALMIGLAPAAFTGNIRGPVRKLAKLSYMGVWVGETFGYPEFRARTTWGKFVSNLFCQDAASTQFLCSNILFLVAGFSRNELNTANLTVIIGHVPAGASWKQFVHYGQGYLNPGHFRAFDYADIEKNYGVYGVPVPPEYQLEKITAPVVLFSSDGDWLATPKDVDMLTKRLPNLVMHQRIRMTAYNHYDFIWGRSSTQTVFQPIADLLDNYL